MPLPVEPTTEISTESRASPTATPFRPVSLTLGPAHPPTMPEAKPDELDCGGFASLAPRPPAAAAIEIRRVHHHSAPLATHLFHRPHRAPTYELRRRCRWGLRRTPATAPSLAAVRSARRRCVLQVNGVRGHVLVPGGARRCVLMINLLNELIPS